MECGVTTYSVSESHGYDFEWNKKNPAGATSIQAYKLHLTTYLHMMIIFFLTIKVDTKDTKFISSFI